MLQCRQYLKTAPFPQGSDQTPKTFVLPVLLLGNRPDKLSVTSDALPDPDGRLNVARGHLRSISSADETQGPGSFLQLVSALEHANDEDQVMSTVEMCLEVRLRDGDHFLKAKSRRQHAKKTIVRG
jgi:hypothetical protein